MNYGVGNLYSLSQALRREGVETEIVNRIGALRNADAVVLPGVGGFRAAAAKLQRDEVLDIAREGKTIVGICLGMQLFLGSSEEGPGQGLGLFPGRVRRLPDSVKVPDGLEHPQG